LRRISSVTIRNVPGAELTSGGRDATLTDCLATCCLLTERLHVGCHDALADGVVSSGVVDEESAVVLFDHGSIIGTGGSRSPPLVDSSKFVQHLLHLIVVDGGVVVGETVARLGDTMEHQQIDAVLPGVGTASDAVEELVILQPQGRIPGLPVCPSVECGVGHVFV